MDTVTAVLLILVGFGAGFVQRVSGFGLGIFAMIFMPHFMPSQTAAVVVSNLFSGGLTTYNALYYRKDIAFKTALPMLMAAGVCIPPAVYCSQWVSGDLFSRLLGGVLIVLSVYFLLFSKKITIRPTAFNGVFSGALSGILDGLFSTSGPPAVLYLSSATPTPSVYFATIQFFFCLTNLYTVATRAVNGDISLVTLGYAAVGFLGCISGNVVGRCLFKNLNAERLKRIIYIGMILSGLVMML